MGQLMQKIMGPLMLAGGAIAAPFTGGATVPVALSGLTEMMGPGGIAGPSMGGTQMASLSRPNVTPTPFTSSVGTDLSPSANTGFSSFSPGAGSAVGSGAGGQQDVLQAAIQQAMSGGGNPFATFA